jgi:6-phosphogluconolactonase
MTSGFRDQTPVRTGGGKSPFGARIERRTTAPEVAQAAADWLASRIRHLSDAQSTVSIAFSGGKTPQTMLELLVRHPLPWDQVHVYQVDERCVEAADPRRNALQLLTTVAPVLETLGLGDRLHLMPIEASDPEASRVAALSMMAAVPQHRFDLVHLGLGDDGHTASLVPGDAVLQVNDADVALTQRYQGTQRVTLTYPALLRAGAVCWIATGSAKAPMVKRLLASDPNIPAGRLGALPGALFVDAEAWS